MALSVQGRVLTVFSGRGWEVVTFWMDGEGWFHVERVGVVGWVVEEEVGREGRVVTAHPMVVSAEGMPWAGELELADNERFVGVVREGEVLGWERFVEVAEGMGRR